VGQVTAEVEPDTGRHGGWDNAPPHDNLAESVAVGAMMLSPAIADAISEILTAADFYKPAHGTIFDTVLALAARGEPIDGATVSTELIRTGDLDRVGGVPYLHTLIESVPTPLNGPYYAQQVAAMAVRRRIADAGVKAAMLARGPGDVADVREQAQQAMYEATTDVRDRAVITSVGDLVAPTLEQIERVAAGLVPPGIPTGLKDYDRMIGGGHRPGQLVIPAGRTSMGKSVITQNWLRHCAEKAVRPAVLFSVEMSVDEMMIRLLAEVAHVPLQRLITAQLTDDDKARLGRAEERIAAWPLYLVDSCRTVPAIRAYLRRFVQRIGEVAVFGVDYLQRLSAVSRGEDRHLVVGQFADDLKTLAQDLGAVCIAPCQLNRGPETRGGKNGNVPLLSDLRESGNLEQSADVVVLIHRPDYYDKLSPRAGEADLIVAKNRNGPTDSITVAAQLATARFVDMAIG